MSNASSTFNTKLVKKHPLAVRWFHWINFPVLMIMIWSGLLIYWANDVFTITIAGHTLFHFFPNKFYDKLKLPSNLASGMAYHFFFMWFFVLNGIAYVLYTAISGEWRYLLPDRNSAKEALHVILHDLHLTKKPLPPRKFNGAQRFAYTGIVIMGVLATLTGFAIYKPVQLAWLTQALGGYVPARFEHFWLMIGFVAFFVIHVLQVMKAGWNNYRAMITGVESIKTPSTALAVESVKPVEAT